MYYILSLVGYEEYHPIWFESTLSKEEFKRAISEVVKPIIKKALENSWRLPEKKE